MIEVLNKTTTSQLRVALAQNAGLRTRIDDSDRIPIITPTHTEVLTAFQ